MDQLGWWCVTGGAHSRRASALRLASGHLCTLPFYLQCFWAHPRVEVLNSPQPFVKSFPRLISEEVAVIDKLSPRFQKNVYPRGQACGEEEESTFSSEWNGVVSLIRSFGSPGQLPPLCPVPPAPQLAAAQKETEFPSPHTRKFPRALDSHCTSLPVLGTDITPYTISLEGICNYILTQSACLTMAFSSWGLSAGTSSN